jgi:uncharacterized membrane protein YedE/YeeE
VKKSHILTILYGFIIGITVGQHRWWDTLLLTCMGIVRYWLGQKYPSADEE